MELPGTLPSHALARHRYCLFTCILHRPVTAIARMSKPIRQAGLFEALPDLPEGCTYRADVIDSREEQDLAAQCAGFALKPFEFRGFLGLRRVIQFGWRYDFNGGGLQAAGPMPDVLLPLRERAASIAGLDAADLVQVLVSEYAPGAGIGWHRDRPQFGTVIGVSLLAPCTLRFRRKSGARWQRASFIAQPRSAYVLTGAAREQWEHSIPALDALRYSVTFRTLRVDAAAPSRQRRP